MDLKGKVAIITGAGRGIGAVIATRLAQAGASVVINDVNQSAEQTAEALRNSGHEAFAILGDASSANDSNNLIEATIAKYGRVDILVNNAGIVRDQLIMRMAEEDWDRVLNIDLKSVFLCTKAALRYMIKQRWGRVISISSIIGLMGNAGQANYAAAKAGIIGFTKTVAKEVASRGVTANAVAPGFIDTEMTQKLPEEQRVELARRIPLGYIGTPQDVAEVVAFLASDEARYITGQVVGVDGGMSIV